MSQITTDSQARKDSPVFTGFLNYFPLAVVEVARLSKASNDKHNPGQALHWSKEISCDHADCLVRHQLEHDVLDTSDGFYHDVKVAWRAMAQLQMRLEARIDVDIESTVIPDSGPEEVQEQIATTYIKIVKAGKMGLSVSLNGDVFESVYSRYHHSWRCQDNHYNFVVTSEDFRLGHVVEVEA